IGVCGRDLRIELSLNIKNRLSNVRDDLCWIHVEETLKLGVVNLTPYVGREGVESFARHRRFVDSLLEIDPLLSLGIRQVRLAEQMLLLGKHELGAPDPGSGDEDDRRNAPVFGRREQRDEAAFAVTGDGDALRIDVLA